MKRKLFVFILSIISAICLAAGLSACGNSNDNSSDNSGGGSDNSKTETVSVTSVTLDFSSLELTVGESYTLSATISPSNATNTNVTWSSSATTIATVSGGKVTAISEGTATITVTTADSGYTATCAVTVTENTVTEHNYISVITAPTCTEKGYTTYTCSDCGETYIDNYVDATGHTESQAVIENYISATCTSVGSYESVIYCSACGMELSRETITIPTTSHNYSSSVTAPTCTEGGYTTHTCPDCGDSYRDNETAALGHTWNDGEITTSPTCTETGVKTYTCTSCGETKTEVIPVTEHSYEISVTQPTCTEGGYTTYICSVCGYSYVDNYTEATGHNYELSWTWDNYSSATATFVCANNENHTEILTATITNEITTAATCTETGIKLYTATVTLNNATYTDTKTEVISAVEHTYENGICTVCGFEEGASYGLTYTLSNDGTYYTVSGIGTCADTEIIIPSTYNFLPVKAIAANAFYNCTSFTSVTIPDSITSIGNSAFYYCTSLTEINFNATAMDDLSSDNFVFYWAGQDGNGITVNIGANVTKIPVCLFCPTYSNGCAPKIIRVVFKENSICESIDNYAFYNCAALKSITLPDSITSVGSYAFRGCTSLTSVSIPDNITSINCGAFYDCTSLTSVSIPDSVTSIDYYAFYNCTSLKSITIGSEVNYIGSEAFYNCLALTEINFNATAMNDFSWNSYVFYRAGQNDEGITVNIGATVTKIPAYLFQSTYSLGDTPKITSVVFEDGNACKSIGEYAFYNCTTLTNITIGENVKSIGEYAFGFCTSLTTAAISENVTSIGGYAFYYCTSLTNIIIPDSITSIDEMAFGSCYKLVEVYNLSSLEITAGSSDNGYVAYYAKTVFTGTSDNSNLIYSGDYIFYKDNGTYYLMCYTGSDTDITLPNNINGYSYSIYQYAFYNCISLESITISNGVTAIGYEAFRSCTSLKTATIGNSVTSIGNYAFEDCSSLTNIAIGSGVTSFGNDVFFNSLYYNNSSNWENNVLYIGNYLIKAKADISGKYSIKEGTILIANYAFFDCASLTSITIPDAVKYICTSAFYECTALTEINFNATALEDLSYNNYAFHYAGQSGDGITVNIGANVTKIPAYLFCSSSNIISVVFEDGSVCESIGEYAFNYCTSLENVTLYSGITSIGEWAFNYCTSLTSITIPDSVTSIGNGAFYYCTALENLTIGNSVTSIGEYAFNYCTSLTSLTIPDSITSIGYSAFNDCTSLTEIHFNATAMDDLSSSNCVFRCAGQNGDGITVTIGANVTKIPAYLFHPYYLYGSDLSPKITIIIFEEGSVCESIGDWAFAYCTSLTSITIPERLTSIGKCVFCDCVAEIIWSENSAITEIGNYAFAGYAGTTLSIPDSVETIGLWAFQYCPSLTSITIGSGVTSIDKYAFGGCTALTEINFNATAMDDLSSSNDVFYKAGQDGNGITVNIGANVTKIPSYLFDTILKDEAPKITAVIFAEGSVCESIGSYVFYGFSDITSITIPDSVKTIGSAAFESCTSLTDVTIGNGVISIGECAFCDCTSLISIDIPDSVKTIGSAAFAYCSLVANLTIGSSVTSIGDSAFYNCANLTSVTIPDSVKTIDNMAFANCTNLASLTIGSGVTSIIGHAFYCTALNVINFNATAMDDLSSDNCIFYCAGQSGNGITVNIGANVTKIPACLFYPISTSNTYSPKIVSVIFAESSVCKTIGSYAFDGCTALTSINIPDGVTSIGKYAFYSCTALESISIGNSVETIDEWTFYNCSALTSLYIGSSVGTIGEYAFYNCTALTSLTIPDSVTSIGNYAFYNCTAEIIWGDNATITEIGNFAFAGYAGTSVTIPCSITSIGNYAFYYCTSLTEINFNATAMDDLSSSNYVFYCAGQDGGGITVTIGANVTKIPAFLFSPNYITSELPKITNVMFEEGSICESIGSYAFYNSTSLTSVTIPERVTSIGSWAFYDCTSLGNIIIPDSVKTIGGSAFGSCISLESVTIGDGVTSIGEYAFSSCTSLTEIHFNAIAMDDLSSDNCIFYCAGQSGNGIKVTIGANVTRIPAYLFFPFYSGEYAPKITGIVFADNSACESIGDWAFAYCISLTSIIIPDSITFIGIAAYDGCNSLTSITIGSGVTSIGNLAFYNCTALTEINFNATSMDNLSDGNSVFHYAGQNGNGVTVNIGANVTKIPAYLFCNSSYIISVEFAEGSICESIGDYAFYYCSSLKSIIIPNSITSIGYATYDGCNSLTSITIGSGVKSIGDYSFYNCTELTEINFNATAMDNLSGGNFVFYNAGQNGGGVTVNIGANVTKIPAYLFSNSSYIISVEFAEGSICESIGNYAFYGCNSLTIITIADNVKTIEDAAFCGCVSLTNITIPSLITSIGERGFEGCYKLVEVHNLSPLNITVGSSDNGYVAYYAKIVYTGTSGNSNLIYSGDYIFYNDNGSYYLMCYTGTDANITLPDNINGYNYSLYQYAFAYCKLLTSVAIPDSVTSISSFAFWYCTSLTSVTIGSGVTSIDGYALYNCTSLTSITIPDSVTSIGWYAFSGCTSLGSVTIGSGVTSIGSFAFYGCATLTSITVDGDNTYYKSVGGNLYSYDGTEFIQYAIGKTDTSFVIPDSVTSISSGTFGYCTSLTSVTIPDSVTSIGIEAFFGCSSMLTSITFENTSGWYVTTTEGATSGTLVDVTDTSANATYLKTTYCNYYWYRSESLDSN